MRMEPGFPGSTQVEVYRGKNKEPHFIIDGAQVEDLDRAKVAEYLRECDWTDRGARGWITPRLRCDEFLVAPAPGRV